MHPHGTIENLSTRLADAQRELRKLEGPSVDLSRERDTGGIVGLQRMIHELVDVIDNGVTVAHPDDPVEAIRYLPEDAALELVARYGHGAVDVPIAGKRSAFNRTWTEVDALLATAGAPTFHVTFHPFVTVKVREGELVDVTMDWGDSLTNIYVDRVSNGEAIVKVWEDGESTVPVSDNAAEGKIPHDVATSTIDSAQDRILEAVRTALDLPAQVPSTTGTSA